MSFNLDSLEAFMDAADEAGSQTGVNEIPLNLIHRDPTQPRKTFSEDTLTDLSASIKAQGVIQPILVRPIDGSKYEIIAGERRWRAAQLAELQDVPVVVREMDDRTTIAVALIENIQRENLNPLEEAHALQRLIDEFDMTHQQAAEAVGRSRTAVSNLLRLLDLGEVATGMVQDGRLEMGHARALLALSGSRQAEAARHVVDHGLSVRATEQLVKKLLAEASHPDREVQPRRRDPDLVILEQDLSDRIGAPVAVQANPKGKGKLVISYNSLDELDGILAHIQ